MYHKSVLLLEKQLSNGGQLHMVEMFIQMIRQEIRHWVINTIKF